MTVDDYIYGYVKCHGGAILILGNNITGMRLICGLIIGIRRPYKLLLLIPNIHLLLRVQMMCRGIIYMYTCVSVKYRRHNIIVCVYL